MKIALTLTRSLLYLDPRLWLAIRGKFFNTSELRTSTELFVSQLMPKESVHFCFGLTLIYSYVNTHCVDTHNYIGSHCHVR